MKRKNLLVSIQNILFQVLVVAWFFMYIIKPDSKFIVFTTIGRTLFFLIPIIGVGLGIINLIIGIKNKNTSKALLILFCINSILFIIEQIMIFVAILSTGIVALIFLIIIYIIICGITISIFIINRKTDMPNDKVKCVTILSVAMILFMVISMLIPGIYANIIKGKIEKELIPKEQVDNNNYAVAYDGDTKENYFIDIPSGEAKFSINSSELMEICYIEKNNSIALKYVVSLDDKLQTLKIININDISKPKEILQLNICNFFNYNIDQTVIFEIFKNKDNYTCKNFLYDNNDESENTNKYLEENENIKTLSKYEDDSNMDYKYFSRDSMTIQIVSPKIKDNINSEQENITKEEYYLIKENENRKIKLECKSLIEDVNEEGNRIIYIYNKKYIPYIDENNNGVFNENGEKIQIPKDYVFLDVNDKIGIVAKVEDYYMGKDYDGYYEEERRNESGCC